MMEEIKKLRTLIDRSIIEEESPEYIGQLIDQYVDEVKRVEYEKGFYNGKKNKNEKI